MTSILRITNVIINSSTNISVSFTENLTTTLVPANVSILSQSIGAPDSQVLKVSILANTLTITCQPLTPYAAYNLQFQSTSSSLFTSVNGDAQISQDGVSNVYLILGPAAPDNPVYQYLYNFLQGNIYNLDDPTTVVSSYIQSLSNTLSRALYNINQVGNENYLSFTVVDELQIRGAGPFDRPNEESVYDVFRVGLGPTGAIAPNTFVYQDFPTFPITLQGVSFTESPVPSSDNNLSTFNINTLTFNLSENPITRVDSIVFTFTTIESVYTYNIQELGYQITDSRYDQDFASSYALLDTNQVKINEAVLQDPNFALDQIFSITIQYEYKDLGRQVDPTSVDVYTTLQSVREVLPPITNIFNLQHAPITTSSNATITTGGVSFLDPNSNTGAPHPAFLTEIPFSLSALPSAIGVYSIDYLTGTVYVYGADATNNGTGPSPPLATYYYLFTFVSQIDYTYDPDLLDLVALPLGNLINNTGSIGFNYEEVFIPGVDYVANCHIEALNESVNNRLIALNSLTTLNSPITNVFQIYNQSTGEIYTLNYWNNNTIYFNYNVAPNIQQQKGENATFANVSNELLTVNNTVINENSLSVFVIFLANNTIIDATQDGIGSSINTSLSFTNRNVFVVERWYNQEFSAAININRLVNAGDYMVDYINGIIYLAANTDQSLNVGSANYKMNSITPEFPHVISVDNIYYRISPLNPINKQFSYSSFSDGSIVPQGLDPSDEGFLNANLGAAYQYDQGQIGTFVGGVFVPDITNAIKFVRGVFEYNDLSDSTNPLNFATVSTSQNYTITVGSIIGQVYTNVQYNGSEYFVSVAPLNIPYLSPGITYTFNVVRTSDNQVLWNSSGTIVAGNPVLLILSGIGSPHLGDLVSVSWTFSIIPLERVIVDYNKGNFFTDYTYLADEILVSYEYGDNVIDFRQNTNLPVNTQYYISYKVGALRDALLKNFGTLVNVPLLATFDLSLDRESYRSCLQAALSSFVQGPTIAAIKNIVETITQVEPEIIEAALEAWSLGTSLLFPIGVEITGSFQLLPAKYDNGVLVNELGQTITLPANSNLRLEEGTLETWILPQWNGLDNDATLTFSILRDGYVIDPWRIFIGPGEYHPTIINGVFSLDKTDDVAGLPNTNKDGIFIYYANDISNNFQRWYFEIIDGYVFPGNHTYKIVISTNGQFYDNQFIDGYQPSNATIFTDLSAINLTINGVGGIEEGLTFLADVEHYLVDFGNAIDNSRFSILKETSGYLTFRVFDNQNTIYSVSADVASWLANEPHMIATSWKLNTRNKRDEMHLFIDGLEMPNIIRYGQKLFPYPGENFRTVDPEQIVGLANADIVGSNDLTTIAGTNVVVSSINFSAFNIFPGNTIFINELGFSTTGYTIEVVAGQTLILNEPMPLTINNGQFSVNETSYIVLSDIEVAPNIAVSTISPFIIGTDLATFSGLNTVSSASTNFTNANVLAGYLLRIDNSNFSLTYTITQVSGHILTLIEPVPVSLSGLTFQIYSNQETEIPGIRALNPSYAISQDINFNNILTISNDVYENDLILIRTLGINDRSYSQQYYVWSDGYENILRTQLPPPISLDQASITRIILPVVAIGPSNSTYTSGVFVSNNLIPNQPSDTVIGRTIQATIAGDNVDFSSPAQITINGVSNGSTISETIDFINYGTLTFPNYFTSINYFQVNVKPLNPANNALTLETQEKYPITYSELNGYTILDGYAARVRYSYPILLGYNLESNGFDGYMTDGYNLFSYLDIGNYIYIGSPHNAVGYYLITGLSTDRHSVYTTPPPPSFSLGTYQVLNISAYRSGLQNGLFTFEIADMPGVPYYLRTGFYEFDYSTYLSAKFDPLKSGTQLYIGTDFNGNNTANAILDQFTIYSTMLTDTRIGEVIPANQLSITKDYNSLIAPIPTPSTLVLLNFDTFPFTNSANTYANFNNDHIHFQSNFAVNDNFEQSIVILNQPILVPNVGILDTRKQGTIEFWMSPLYDTANDPVNRYYFDAYGAVVENATSVSNVAVKISAPANQILSVRLAAGNPNIDYFAGGRLDIDLQNAIQEEGMAIGTNTVAVSQPILQVISVTIIGDASQRDYFANGTIGTDQETIYLGIPLPQNNLSVLITYQSTNNNNTTFNTQIIRLNKRLPSQNTAVIVEYIPAGLQGDRLSLFKDTSGYFNFSITASGTDFVIRAPTRWAKNTWHRVKAEYMFNSGVGTDQMRLFLDGYQYSDVLFGENMTYGYFPAIMGAVSVGDGYGLIASINFKDPINDLFIGTDYTGASPIYTLLDNFRISNVFRPIYAPYGEPMDVNWSSNLATVLPITKDLYTTYLMDFNDQIELDQTNFTTLIDRETGGFDFTINIFDSFGIVASNIQIQNILESLIDILQPATSQSYIKYIPPIS